jgi:hypothetical protein
MALEVVEERVAAGSLERQLAGRQRVMQLCPRRKALAPEMQRHVAHRAPRVGAQQRAELCDAHPRLVVGVHQAECGEAPHEASHHARIDARAVAELVERQGRLGEQVGDAQAGHHVHELRGHEAEDQVTHPLPRAAVHVAIPAQGLEACQPAWARAIRRDTQARATLANAQKKVPSGGDRGRASVAVVDRAGARSDPRRLGPRRPAPAGDFRRHEDAADLHLLRTRRALVP